MGQLLEGKICLVTGGGSGIGAATCREMAGAGALAVAVVDTNIEGARRTAETVREAGAEAVPLRCDVTSAAAVERVMSVLEERFGSLDVLHNNAGVLDDAFGSDRRVDLVPEQVWDTVMAINVKGAWLTTKHAVPLLRKSRAGAIVNCGSTSSYLAYPGEAAYCTSKAAILGLTRATALDLAKDRIRCNCYCPSSTATPMLDAHFSPGRHRLALSRGPTRLGRDVDRPRTSSASPTRGTRRGSRRSGAHRRHSIIKCAFNEAGRSR